MLNLIIVTPRRMVLLEQVPEKGYWYYVWEQDKRGREKEQEIKNLTPLGSLKRTKLLRLRAVADKFYTDSKVTGSFRKL